MCVCEVTSCQIHSDPKDCSPPSLHCPWDSPGKNTGVGCHEIKSVSLMSPALAGEFFTTSTTWKTDVFHVESTFQFGFQPQYVTNGCHVESSFHPSPFGEINDVNCIWLFSCSVMSFL